MGNVMDVHDELRQFWDDDAATYDRDDPTTGHVVTSAAERAAWARTLTLHLPPPPAAVLDVGAGTGFVSLQLARLGYDVTALDLSSGMLAKLDAEAKRQGLRVRMVEGRADAPPAGPFAAVVERLLLWTLPDPVGTVARWRSVAPGGRLLAFEAMWGTADRLEGLRERARDRWRRWRRRPPEHHEAYAPDLSAKLPLPSTPPADVVTVVEEAGWSGVGLERLRDVEWAISLALPPSDRLLGVTPQFVVSAVDRR